MSSALDTMAAQARERQHAARRVYLQGWRWGLLCGLLWGALATGTAVLLAGTMLAAASGG